MNDILGETSHTVSRNLKGNIMKIYLEILWKNCGVEILASAWASSARPPSKASSVAFVNLGL